MIYRYQCCSRSGVWRFHHSFDKEGVCIFCDRDKYQAEYFLRALEMKWARIYWNRELGKDDDSRRRQEKYRHYELSE